MYQWERFLKYDNICFVDATSQRFEIPDKENSIILDITRVPKHIGFYLLKQIDPDLVPPTVTLDQIHKLIPLTEKVICKPIYGARAKGLIIGSPGEIAEVVLSGDFKDASIDKVKDLFPKSVQFLNTDGYEEFVFESLKNYQYIVQPFLSVIDEYRIYVATPYQKDDYIFPYVVRRDANYFLTRNNSNKHYVIENYLKLSDSYGETFLSVAYAIRSFMKLSGKHWPALSVDVVFTGDGKPYIIDYGIEFAIPYIIRDNKYFSPFVTWLHECIDAVVKEVYRGW